MALTLVEYVSSFLAATPAISCLTKLYPPPVLIVAISPKRWRCDTGDHRWHTSQIKARRCAFSALPFASITWQQINQPWSEVGS